MNSEQDTSIFSRGFCLVELLTVIALVGISLVMAVTFVGRGLDRQKARETALTTQAAVAWSQLGVLWHGGVAEVSVGSGEVGVEQDLGLFGGTLESATSSSSISANVGRWNQIGRVALRITSSFASPDSGGSIYIVTGLGAYRVVVRPESGLTWRSWSDR
jgi:prepilin-type N-terminal cleavage/methylation domain-containing protein